MKPLLLFISHKLHNSGAKTAIKNYVNETFRIAQLIYKELNRLHNKIPFFDHWESCTPYTLIEVLPLITVFSQIEATASINIFVKKYCFYARAAPICGIFCNNPKLSNMVPFVRCHCLGINLLYQTGFYLLFSLSKLRLVFESSLYSRKYSISFIYIFRQSCIYLASND